MSDGSRTPDIFLVLETSFISLWPSCDWDISMHADEKWDHHLLWDAPVITTPRFFCFTYFDWYPMYFNIVRFCRMQTNENGLQGHEDFRDRHDRPVSGLAISWNRWDVSSTLECSCICLDMDYQFMQCWEEVGYDCCCLCSLCGWANDLLGGWQRCSLGGTILNFLPSFCVTVRGFMYRSISSGQSGSRIDRYWPRRRPWLHITQIWHFVASKLTRHTCGGSQSLMFWCLHRCRVSPPQDGAFMSKNADP